MGTSATERLKEILFQDLEQRGRPFFIDRDLVFIEGCDAVEIPDLLCICRRGTTEAWPIIVRTALDHVMCEATYRQPIADPFLEPTLVDAPRPTIDATAMDRPIDPREFRQIVQHAKDKSEERAFMEQQRKLLSKPLITGDGVELEPSMVAALPKTHNVQLTAGLMLLLSLLAGVATALTV